MTSAESRFLLVRIAGIALGVPMVFVIVTFGVDSIFNRPDPAGDLASMRYVMVGLIVLLSAGQCWYELRPTGVAQKIDGEGRQEDE